MPASEAEKTIQSRARIEALINHAFMREVIRKVTGTIAPFNDIGFGPPLYCVHPIGGGATEFLHMARVLGPNQKFYAIQVPTDRRNAEFGRSIKEISRYYVDELVKFQPDGAFLLGGHSVGATIALEMSHQLIARRREVSLLVVFDGALLNTGAEISSRNPRYWLKLLLNVPRWLVEERPLTNRRRLAHKAMARLQSVVSKVFKKNLAATHPIEHYMNLDGYFPDHAAFIKALYDSYLEYIPHHYSGRVLVFVAKTYPLFHVRQVKAPWAKIAPSSEFVEIDATHASMMKMAHVVPVAERLRKAIEEIHRNRPQTIQATSASHR